jgi:hypothetical protein
MIFVGKHKHVERLVCRNERPSIFYRMLKMHIIIGRTMNQEQIALQVAGKLDYPFEQFIDFNNLNPDEVARNIIREKCQNENIPVRFLLKYVFENENTKRLIFLYVSDIEEEELFNGMHLEGGKLWTETQIEDNIGNNLFSECFELEYEYLKNTILMVRHLKEKSNSLNDKEE